MGSPIAPTLANVFLCHNETRWLDECPSEFKPIVYRRYVDDTFVVFRKTEHADKFLEYLNSRHSSLKFTCEQEQSSSLAFLDILVTRGATFSTTLYRKPTFTGLFSNYYSFVPLRFKLNLISTLVFRIYNICSNVCNVHSELEKLCTILVRNGYPKHVVQKIVKFTFTKLHCPKIPVHTCSKKKLYFSIPFTGKHSLYLRNSLLNSCEHITPRLICV